MTIGTQSITISSNPFFAGLPPGSIERMLLSVVTKTHARQSTIYHEGDSSSSVYFILSGWVKLSTCNLKGKQITLDILNQDEMFGETASLNPVLRSTDALALTTTITANISGSLFLDLLKTEPFLGLRLVNVISHRLRQANERLRLGESNSTSRVVATLLFLSQKSRSQSSQGIELPKLCCQDLSALCGLARETVGRVLQKLEKNGLISRFEKTIYFSDRQALESLVS